MRICSIVYAAIVLVSLVSCGRYPEAVELALEKSGENRSELEKVLKHYAVRESDSLKLRAAEFLIANMPGHYSIGGAEVERYVDEVDAMYPDLEYCLYPAVYLQPYYEGRLTLEPARIYDVDRLTAGYLIRNIDFKFALRELAPWGREVPFDLFCETVLPYRCSVEPLKDIPEDSLAAFLRRFESATAYENLRCDYNTARTILRPVVSHFKPIPVEALPEPMGRFSHSCTAVAIASQCRSMWSVLPSYIDFTPRWGNRDGSHFWTATCGFGNRRMTSNEILTEAAPKVYRMTFESSGRGGNDVFDTGFLRDVTKEYLNCTEVAVEPTRRGTDGCVYLCIFSERRWIPVAWTERHGSRAIFSDVGSGILYMPMVCDGGTMVCAGAPFYVDLGGRVVKTEPDADDLRRVSITRKYPLSDRQVNYGYNMCGTVIEASDNSDFDGASAVDSIAAPVMASRFLCDTAGASPFRYWRLRRKTGVYVSEAVFRDRAGRKIAGRPLCDGFGTASALSAAFDGEILTCGRFQEWVGVDFGHPVEVGSVEIVPQTDANFIYPGDVYELSYHDGTDWVVHEVKEAEGDRLEFCGVPSGALYWLRNITAGKEERPFVMIGETVRFL